ncbi:MAG: efflux RND transporter periplasmic adaptor subunit [Beijerinckiaceae bacterium]|nr:efflux RND transporter periplasmic adaptor subunit [Beijerinckiaceae bacterium]
MGGSGFWLGTHPLIVSPYVDAAMAQLGGRPVDHPTAGAAMALPTQIAYYRDPDGKAAYSATPRKTADGRDFIAVDAVADVRFAASGTLKAAAEPAAAAPDAPRKIKFYRNPMGLPDTSPVPKKDNMGMDYLPVYEGGDGDANTVTVSPGRLQTTGVRSEAAELRRISQTIRVPGTVQLDERRIAVVATRSDAYVDKVANVTTGDRVKKGEPLLTLYSPEINSAAAQLMANPGYDGSRRRLQNLNVPEAVIAEIERTHTLPASITWSSPRDGIVLERGAVEGMKAASGAVLFRIGDISTMWVLADVPEHDIAFVRVGEQVSVRVRSQPNRAYVGRVGVIYPQVNAATRSTRVRIELPNPDGSLLADMYADVTIASVTPAPAVAVPDDAVIDAGTKQTVIIDRGGGRLEPRPVQVGIRGNGFTEIRDGVKAGDKVVTSANFLIDAESNLKAALEGLSAANTSEGAKP